MHQTRLRSMVMKSCAQMAPNEGAESLFHSIIHKSAPNNKTIERKGRYIENCRLKMQ